ncbi:MAG TPA: arylamine N-acetyltransferase [Acidobacteriota bacterium]|nr:arylamine N-acetyltransferase [Acidobacteriota bacterium]
MTGGILDLDSYFERISYGGKTAVSEETLRELHIAHTLNIPFENLDVFYGVPILLDGPSLFNKLVNNRRGGYCFEMNGLFSLVLQQLGFRVKNLLARTTLDGIEYMARTHQVLLVESGERRWLADVGYGNDGITAPLLLEKDRDQQQFSHTYRLIEHEKLGHVLQKKVGGDTTTLYAFTMDECLPMDFLMSNHFTATYPESFFLTMRMCTKPTREGRITLTDTRFKISADGDTAEKPIEDEDEFKRTLSEYFGLNLDRIKP